MQPKILLILFLFLISPSLANSNQFSLSINQWPHPKNILVNNVDAKMPSHVNEKIEECTLKTTTGINVPVTFYNRNSDTIIIAAQGLPAAKESMTVFAKLFPEYDVILFDYRWRKQYSTFLMKSVLAGNPVQQVLLDEVEELQAVIEFIHKRKQYKKIIGLGQCYSCFHLAKVQADEIKKTGNGPFTHLIFDSCWHSLRHFAERICFDPFLPGNPRYGGAPQFLKWLTNNAWIKKLVMSSSLLRNNVSVAPYIAKVNIPLLFIHGHNDLFVPINHFKDLWSAANNSSRAVLYTPYYHSDNLKNKKIYYGVTKKFIESNSIEEFENKCRSFDLVMNKKSVANTGKIVFDRTAPNLE